MSEREMDGWGRSGLSDRQRGVLAFVAVADLLLLFGLVMVLGGLMQVATDGCFSPDYIPVCDASAESAFRMNAIGQIAIFGSATAIALFARPFRVKLLALGLAPILGAAAYVHFASTIVRR